MIEINLGTKVVIDGEHECTWGEFLEANVLSNATVAEIVASLQRGETYEEPAGGSAGWTVALASP